MKSFCKYNNIEINVIQKKKEISDFDAESSLICVSIVINGLYSGLEFPLPLISIVGKHLFLIGIASTKTVSPGQWSLLGAVPSFRYFERAAVNLLQ